MRKVFLALFASVSMLLVAGAQAQMQDRPSISVTGVQVFCQGNQPYASVTLPINQTDQGLPGLIYVGAHDPSMSQAAFLSGSNWIGWQSGLYPPYMILSGGLQTTTITLALPPNLAGGGWKLYAGYGALTAQSESSVQMLVSATAATRAVIPNGTVAAVDPDHYRRTLIQNDMTQVGKYAYVATGVENNASVCQR